MSAQLPIREATRLPNYDYSTPSAYFVTVCTHSRIDYFENPDCVRICREVWESLPEHHNVKLDQFVIMPDHIHFILWICAKPELGGDFKTEDNETGDNCTTGGIHASRPDKCSPNLSTVVQNLKAETTRRIRAELEIGFGWQRSFYDHVIRNEIDLSTLRDYILNNPMEFTIVEEY